MNIIFEYHKQYTEIYCFCKGMTINLGAWFGEYYYFNCFFYLIKKLYTIIPLTINIICKIKESSVIFHMIYYTRGESSYGSQLTLASNIRRA